MTTLGSVPPLCFDSRMKLVRILRSIARTLWNGHLGVFACVVLWVTGVFYALAPGQRSPDALDWELFILTEVILSLILVIVLLLPYALRAVIEQEGLPSVWLAIPVLVLCTIVQGAWADWMVSHVARGSFSGVLTRVDSLYLSATTLTTAGNDLQPLSAGARLLITAQTLVDFLVIGGAVAIVIQKIGALRDHTSAGS